jgi:7-cyano-7-deazaguanine synthase
MKFKNKRRKSILDLFTSTTKPLVVVLFSGGIDSTALVQYYLSKNYFVKAIHFNYGQKNNIREKEAVNAIGKYYNIEISSLNFGFELNSLDGEYIGRNPLFILAASNLINSSNFKISIGIHQGTPYYDCSVQFLKECQQIVDGYFGGTVLIEAPFIDFNKKHIYEYCLNNNVPIHLTYSCEISNIKPCGECTSCKDRRILNGLL